MERFEIRNEAGQVLNTIDEWKLGFNDDIHWKEGYSAHSLAQFFTSGKGFIWLDELANIIFEESIIWQDAIIEHKSKLDSYRGKHRMQDLALWGATYINKSVFVGIEAKVLESFGNYSLRDEYEDALNYQKTKNNNSNRPDRVKETTEFLFPGRTPYDEKICNLRYQLMYYFRASILEAASYKESIKALSKRKRRADIVVLPVLIFETNHYKSDTEKGRLNKYDYEVFCETLGLKKEIIRGKEFWAGEIDGRKIYSLYEKIDLCTTLK